MKNKKVMSAALLVVAVACQKTTGPGGTAAPALGSISALPAITDPAKGNSFPSIAKSSVPRTLASNGIKLKDWATPFGASTSWSASYSRAMCEAGLVEKNAFGAAAAADQLKCVVGALDTGSYDPAPAGPITIQYGSATLASAPDNIFVLTGSLAGTGKLVRVNAVKSAGAITGFRAYVCGGGSGSWTQQAYFDFSVSGNSGVARSMIKGTQTFQSNQFDVSEYSKASGTLDGASWTNKAIDLVMHVGGTYDTYDSTVNIDQKKDAAKLLAWAKGSCTHGGTTHPFTAQTATSTQLLGDSMLSTIAFGAGSAKWSGTWDAATFANTSSWDGDTGMRILPATGGDFYADVATQALPTVPSSSTITIGFSGVTYPTGNTLTVPEAPSDFAWDCATGVPTTPTSIELSASTTQLDVLQKAALATCNDKYSYGTGTGPGYVDCHASNDQ